MATATESRPSEVVTGVISSMSLIGAIIGFSACVPELQPTLITLQGYSPFSGAPVGVIWAFNVIWTLSAIGLLAYVISKIAQRVTRPKGGKRVLNRLVMINCCAVFIATLAWYEIVLYRHDIAWFCFGIIDSLNS